MMRSAYLNTVGIEMTPVPPEAQQGTQPQEKSHGEESTEELPPLTYVDFLPQNLGKELDFAQFGSTLEQANQWLSSKPQFCVYKCETISVKLGGKDLKVDNDGTFSHFSANGKNIYLRILRVWLIPKIDTEQPVQKIGYITVLPEHSGGDLNGYLSSLASAAANRSCVEVSLTSFDNLAQTVAKLNQYLQTKPIPGRILTVESLPLKCQETNSVEGTNTEAAVWTEGGANFRFYLNALRIFYIVGQPAFETIGIHDEQPDVLQNKDDLGLPVKLASFKQTVSKASQWLQKQQGIRVVNVGTVSVKLDRKHVAGTWSLDTQIAGYAEQQSISECRYCKVLRIAYVKDQKEDSPSPYSQVTLTSRIFIPRKIEGKRFESFSKTILRVIKWLRDARAPLFACETVKYLISADSKGQGFNDERLDTVVTSYNGQYYITCIRLYFSCLFQEPASAVPGNPDQVTDGRWSCAVS